MAGVNWILKNDRKQTHLIIFTIMISRHHQNNENFRQEGETSTASENSISKTTVLTDIALGVVSCTQLIGGGVLHHHNLSCAASLRRHTRRWALFLGLFFVFCLVFFFLLNFLSCAASLWRHTRRSKTTKTNPTKKGQYSKTLVCFCFPIDALQQDGIVVQSNKTHPISWNCPLQSNLAVEGDEDRYSLFTFCHFVFVLAE